MKQQQGRIVNITSIGGKIAVPHMLPYTSSKFALMGLSEGMHAELKKYNIHVTTVVPNLMRTGSPRNVDVKGDHQAEYAWFKTADAMPGLTQDAVLAARRIIRALEYGESEAILTFTAKVATFIKVLAPGWVNTALAITNALLPKDIGEGNITLKGFEAESSASRNRIAYLSDKAATKNNE